ncbi:ADP-ribose pyrophosphatase [Sulfurivirga caldicuralii]|uniref:ADP-ribose pyrophosphatase n=1 Tax=Sulfurivirga caldicuralii TaxID=364032 RepID=A0A1N6FBC3_9GAMM|nr:NUDIX domain-containing protein [Sulfurivirga caldicuralii]SIN92547.1 ADP-ribose pyrophosphatase [Sulfurivirga caldicuralii]
MNKRVEILAQQRVYDGFYKVDRLKVRCTRFDGSWSPVHERELYGRPQPVVVVILYDPDRKETLLLEQCRIGPLAYYQDERAWLLEPVAGHVDAGETLEQACVRETREETTLEVDPARLEFVCHFYPTPGGGRERLHVYAAAISLAEIPETAGHAAEGEDIRLHRLSFDEVRRKLEAGMFEVASTWIGMQWLVYRKWPQLKAMQGA